MLHKVLCLTILSTVALANMSLKHLTTLMNGLGEIDGPKPYVPYEYEADAVGYTWIPEDQ